MIKLHTDVVNFLFARGIIGAPSGRQQMSNFQKILFRAGGISIASAAVFMLFALVVAADAQTKAKPAKAKASKPLPVKADEPSSAVPAPGPSKEEPKKNARPNEVIEQKPAPAVQSKPEYTYVFTRPGFTYERVVIEHDDSGKGTVTFKKSAYDEQITDPVSLSAKTMTTLRVAYDALDFLDSTESYQVARDYSHMGTIELTLRRIGRERTVRYNWTDNKNARALMDEYRRIANEYTWRFEISLARENQPLQAPGLMNVLESYVKRNEISDAKHLVPFLKELSTDERLPLMVRNRAAELAKQIEKAKQ